MRNDDDLVKLAKKGQRMETYDHYQETLELAAILRKEDLNDYAEALLQAMEDGATGTEIFMALRWNVKNLIQSGRCPRIAETKAKKLFQELDRALQ